MKNVHDMTADELYAELVEEYDNLPTRGKMSASRDPEVSYRMATLKRTEDKLNRYRNQGVL